MVTSEATNEMKEIILGLLNERFKDEFEFGPIIVMPRIDDDGEGVPTLIHRLSR